VPAPLRITAPVLTKTMAGRSGTAYTPGRIKPALYFLVTREETQ
jgi:hypothetical protein